MSRVIATLFSDIEDIMELEGTMNVDDAMDFDGTAKVEDQTVRSPFGRRTTANGHESQISLAGGVDSKPIMLFRCLAYN
jgi:hypothetical protein